MTVDNNGSASPENPGRCYFDWAATAIPEIGCSDIAAPFGNPSSRHQEGQDAREALENARSRCAAVLGVKTEHIYFTSGGTESNAVALHGMLLRKSVACILSSAVEHPSIRENCLVLERLGKQTASIGVEKDGRVTPSTLEQALEQYPHARFAAILGVNNEIGSRMDIPALVKIIRNRKNSAPIHIHSDLVQAAGKVPLDLSAWDVDSASISAHKLGGPRGIGLLYLRKALNPIYTGGGQERGLRPGTENTAGAIALAECLERHANPAAVQAEYQKASERFKRLIRFLRTLRGGFLIPEDREEEDERFSPYIVQAGFRGIPGEVMVRGLDDAGFAVSTGSACSSSSQERPALRSMGLDKQTSLEGIRISQGWTTTIEDIDRLTKAIEAMVVQFGFGREQR
ncbi:MAG: aminotransferase class V-fold PLP-dependent enzyme [Treponema sp.]|jgi:cysteine desulfurase|nr:aminotransferase class V-fold PLP-dependent enzyme [Treponema sp.]